MNKFNLYILLKIINIKKSILILILFSQCLIAQPSRWESPFFDRTFPKIGDINDLSIDRDTSLIGYYRLALQSDSMDEAYVKKNGRCIFENRVEGKIINNGDTLFLIKRQANNGDVLLREISIHRQDGRIEYIEKNCDFFPLKGYWDNESNIILYSIKLLGKFRFHYFIKEDEIWRKKHIYYSSYRQRDQYYQYIINNALVYLEEIEPLKSKNILHLVDNKNNKPLIVFYTTYMDYSYPIVEEERLFKKEPQTWEWHIINNRDMKLVCSERFDVLMNEEKLYLFDRREGCHLFIKER